jgi:hypothetical protein
MDSLEYQRWEAAFLKETFSPYIQGDVNTSDDGDFYPGQRFYVECYSPLPCVVFLEMDYTFKQNLIQGVFKKKWSLVSPILRDDCFLECLNIILQKQIVELYGCDNLYFRYSFPRVLYDTYQDDLEASTQDLYRFDYKWADTDLSLIAGMPPGPFLGNYSEGLGK